MAAADDAPSKAVGECNTSSSILAASKLVEEGKLTEALEVYRSAAQEGEGEAALEGALLLLQHKDIAVHAHGKRLVEVVSLLRLAAQCEAPAVAAKAAFRLGYLWETGRMPESEGGRKDPKRAAAQYRASLALAPGPAVGRCGAEARRLLAGIILRGEGGETVDHAAALGLCLDAARVQDSHGPGAKAAHLAASMLEAGAPGVPQDWVGAVGCYRQAVRHAEKATAPDDVSESAESGTKAKVRLEELAPNAASRASYATTYASAGEVPLPELLNAANGALMLLVMREGPQWHPSCRKALLKNLRTLLLRGVALDPSSWPLNVALLHLDTVAAGLLPCIDAPPSFTALPGTIG